MRISSEMRSAWTEYWKTGNFESLPKDRAAGMLASLDTAWNEFFARQRDGARLLDLATGGGDLIRRALSLGRGFDITGIDIADLSPVAASLEGQGVTLIGHTDLSQLPFPDAEFDCVVSQFGIEYADARNAVPEAVRVLAPGGQGHFVMHHAQGAITQGVVNSLAAERSVFPDYTVFDLARSVFELRLRSAGAPEIAAAEHALREAVDVALRRLRHDNAFAPARNVAGFLAHLAQSPQMPAPEAALQRIDQVEAEVKSRILRKEAQRDASLDGSGMAALAGLLRDCGAEVLPPGELRYPGGRILGWSLSFRR